MSEIKGIYAATLSILDKNLALDVKNTIQHAENVIDSGCHGVVFFGSTGQSQLISLSEKIQLINELPKSRYKNKFLIGTGLNSLIDTINIMKISKSIYTLIDFVPRRLLKRVIASSSLSGPTTTAEPFFMKLTERSFVLIDNPKSP